MTGEEMERAIEFMLERQANFEIKLEQTNQQVAETSRQLQAYAETQSEFIQIVTNAIRGLTASGEQLAAAQRRTDERLILTNERLALADERLALTDERLALTDERLVLTDERVVLTDEHLMKTDERLNNLAGLVERFISEGRNGHA